MFQLFQLFLLSAGVYLALSGAFAEASWFIDAEKFHASAHGQFSCQDCHGDIIDRSLHPDPSDVGKQLTDFFHPEQCVECHDNVPEDLERKRHGAQEIDSADSYANCLECHNSHQALSSGDETENVDPDKPPEFAAEDQACIACHRLIRTDEPGAAENISQRCFFCHANAGTDAQKVTSRSVGLIAPQNYRATPHSNIACTACHLQAASFEHGAQPQVDCRQCHLPHDESTAHDAHGTVACKACHLPDMEPVRDAGSGRIIGQRERQLNAALNVHEMIVAEDEAACRRCHTGGNPVGASAMVLPAKSVICMPCHTATLSFGDTITAVSLVVFWLGLGISLLLMLAVASGRNKRAGLTVKTSGSETPRSTKERLLNIVRVANEIVLNVLFQKRLFDRSPGRWCIHGLLFFPMALRFMWGIVALSGSLWRPQWPWVWQAIDKNNGVTAFFFDITGTMILAGVILALLRPAFDRADPIDSLPRRSRLGLVLLGGIVAVGFVLEGMRIAMTGAAGDAAYAFVGYGLSTIFSGPEALSDVYGYIWYVHAALTGAFIVYLPFSRLLHIILSPVVLALNAATARE